MLSFSGQFNSLENCLAAAIFLFSLAYLAICTRCLALSQPYDLQGQVFTLAFCFLTDNWVSLPNRGWWYIGRKQAGRVRKMSVDRLEVMKQWRTTNWTPKTSAECATNVRELWTSYEYSKNLSCGKISMPRVVRFAWSAGNTDHSRSLSRKV